MSERPLHTRRLAVRLALLFAVWQVVAIVGAVYGLPAMRGLAPVPVLVSAVLIADLVILVLFATWIIEGEVSSPLERLSTDVQRIADGDYHHRVGDVHRSTLREIRDSVNRLADRLIQEQERLAENVASLDETNRELRAARDQVVRSARLASVGTLAAGIAHEVGNPLGAIIGFVDVAKARVQKSGGDVELLDSIRGEAKRIDQIVRGLLNYARPASPDAAPTTVGAVVAEVRALLERQGKLDGVETRWLADRASEHIVEQPHRIEQVLVNLLLNALHAVRGVPSPQIEVRVAEDEGVLGTMPARREDDPPGINYMHRRRRERDGEGVGSVASAERLTVIEVLDNGHGFDRGVAEQLFDPFFTTKDPGEGTGLGLSICARLVEGLGGEIEALDSELGGARFVIRLPSVYHSGEEAP